MRKGEPMSEMMYTSTMNEPSCVVKQESAKVILTNTDEILRELENQLEAIESAIFSPSPKDSDGRDPQDECMLTILNIQRNMAERLLKIAVHIREGLW